MEAQRRAQPTGTLTWRLWALVPILAAGVAVGGYVASGSLARRPDRLEPAAAGSVRRPPRRVQAGRDPRQGDEPAADDLTIASVTVDDAIVPFSLDGPQTLGRLRSSTIVIPYDWVQGADLGRGHELLRDRDGRGDRGRSRDARCQRGGFLGYAIIGFLVGVLPVALGLLWLPSLRRVDQRWLTAFMAMTAGLLSFLGVEALFEAFQLQGALPGAFGGAGPRVARGGDELPDDDVHLAAVSRPTRTESSAVSHSPRWSRSESGCTTSAKGWRSERRLRSDSSRSARS